MKHYCYAMSLNYDQIWQFKAVSVKVSLCCSVLIKQHFILLRILHFIWLLFLQKLMFRSIYQIQILFIPLFKTFGILDNAIDTETECDDPFQSHVLIAFLHVCIFCISNHDLWIVICETLTVKLTKNLVTASNFCINYCDLWIVVCEALTENL